MGLFLTQAITMVTIATLIGCSTNRFQKKFTYNDRENKTKDKEEVLEKIHEIMYKIEAMKFKE